MLSCSQAGTTAGSSTYLTLQSFMQDGLTDATPEGCASPPGILYLGECVIQDMKTNCDDSLKKSMLSPDLLAGEFGFQTKPNLSHLFPMSSIIIS